MSSIGEKDGIIKMREGWDRGNREREGNDEGKMGQREQGRTRKR